MTTATMRHPMFGFLCAACGRCLEELQAWQLGAERFHCGIFCRELDERLHAPDADDAAPRKARARDRSPAR
jgi:hypothetical protein